MTRYTYRALDAEGEAVEGSMEESSAYRVTRRLQERGCTLTNVRRVHADPPILRISHRLTWNELEIFTDQLAAVTASELPLPPALKALAGDVESPRMHKALDGLHHDLEGGATLEESLEKNQHFFPSLFASMVRAGEKAGNLSGVLNLLSQHSARMVELKNNLQIALTYPCIVLVFGVAVIAFMLVKVIPVFGGVIEEFGGHLPAPTAFILFISEYCRSDWPNLLLALGVAIFFFFLIYWRSKRSPSLARRLDTLFLSIPIWGKHYRLTALSRFSRTLSMLLQAETPILESLEIAGAASGSPVIANVVEEAALQIANGAQLAEAFRETHYFPHNFCWLLSTAEKRGEADKALEYLAEGLERSTKMRGELISTFIGPCLIFAVGLIISLIIVSLYLPIFIISDQISGT